MKAALGILADNAAAEVLDEEMERYAVVRIADEVVVDLMARACGVTYDDAPLPGVSDLRGPGSVIGPRRPIPNLRVHRTPTESHGGLKA